MSFVLLLTLVAPQKLEIRPHPGLVGTAVAVRATRAGQALSQVPIAVRLPDGGAAACGTTDTAGVVEFVPTGTGEHVFEATIDGVRVLAPLPVTEARRPWVVAAVLVPLGLALAWQNLRRRVDVAPAARSADERQAVDGQG